MNANIENLSKALYDRISENRHVDEELFIEFMEALASSMTKEPGKAPSSLVRLKEHLASIFASSRYGRDELENAFNAGMCWGMVGLHFEWRGHIQGTEARRRSSEVVAEHKELFLALHRKPGIMHKELAEATGKSPSRLSQIIATLDREGLFTSSLTGRCKKYYLTDLGKSAMRELESQEGSASVLNDNPQDMLQGYSIRFVIPAKVSNEKGHDHFEYPIKTRGASQVLIDKYRALAGVRALTLDNETEGEGRALMNV